MNNIREWLAPETRGRVYTAASAIVAALVVFGVVSSTMAASIAGVVLGVITLVYAIVHSESTVRTAAYGLCAAIGALLVTIGAINDDQQDALLAIVPPVLGITLAAAKTPNEPKKLWVEHNAAA